MDGPDGRSTEASCMYRSLAALGWPGALRPGGPNVLTDRQVGLAPYQFDFAGEGLVRRRAPDATAAEVSDTRLSVSFAPQGRLPKAEPGKSRSGTFAAVVFPTGKDDGNQSLIGRT